jgi:hypothetical protein
MNLYQLSQIFIKENCKGIKTRIPICVVTKQTWSYLNLLGQS